MTSHGPSVLCPIDFSEPSRSALRHAVALADHFGARLVVLTIDDPLLAEAVAATGRTISLADETLVELKRFYRETLGDGARGPKTVEFRVAIGKPAPEILREARDTHADAIVIASHGRSGFRKRFFGSTTERVLRETPVPVLITPDDRAPTGSLSEIASHVNRVITPVDLTPASRHQLTVAAGIAEALSVPLLAVHVLEPIFVPYSVRLALPGVEATRRTHAEETVSDLVRATASHVRTETMVMTGEPSEQIAALADARQANLIVMGLHSSGLLGPRMGSVTYRVLSVTKALVLAIPPRALPAAHTLSHQTAGASSPVLGS